jgi:hypothetical protein
MQDMTSERTTLLSPTDTSSIVDKLDEVDLCLLLLLLQILEGNLIVLRANLEAALDHIRKDELAAQRAKPNVPAQRRSFNAIAGVLSPIHFWRMFRMKRASFDRLCKCIISKVGDDAVFKSQEWLDSCSRDNEEATTRTSSKRKTQCATNALGGTLSGEVNVAVMLRLMAGASYLDLLLIFGIAMCTIYNVFHEATAWIVATFQFPLVKWIVTKDEVALQTVADAFSSASGGTCIRGK